MSRELFDCSRPCQLPKKVSLDNPFCDIDLKRLQSVTKFSRMTSRLTGQPMTTTMKKNGPEKTIHGTMQTNPRKRQTPRMKAPPT